jgi:hypothetical protein
VPFPVIEPQPVWAGAISFNNIEVAVSVEIGQSHVECDVRAQSLVRIDKSAFAVVEPDLIRLPFRVSRSGTWTATATWTPFSLRSGTKFGSLKQRSLEDLLQGKFAFAFRR